MSEQNPPQSISSIFPLQEQRSSEHTHTFQITSARGIIMRLCPECGKTWILNRPDAPGLAEWMEVKEL